ncbi:MAG: hypothetical protein HXY40_04040 [Chloroflexi bacterium]|nr:hypothetical protein [Chloroflexota bacterium]
MDNSTAEVILYLTGAAGFFSALLSLVAMLTIARQMRSLQDYRLVRRAAAEALVEAHLLTTRPIPAQPYIPPARKTLEVPRVRLTPLPADYQPAPREGTPDQVIIIIEPESGPTRQEKNVLRLIDFLKNQKPAVS